MICPNCGHNESKVIDKRNNLDANSIRRRRECMSCKERYTTYEKLENSCMLVRKKSGRLEEFDKKKLRNSLLKGLKKRHISEEEIDHIVDKIELDLNKKKKTIVESQEIGEAVLNSLGNIDKVAYMLYATVYKDFDSIEELESAIENIKYINQT